MAPHKQRLLQCYARLRDGQARRVRRACPLALPVQGFLVTVGSGSASGAQRSEGKKGIRPCSAGTPHRNISVAVNLISAIFPESH